MSLSSLNSLVTSMTLSPCFLEQKWPELSSFSLREGWFITVDRNIIIHYNLMTHTILGEPDGIDSLIIYFVINKYSPDTFGFLSNNTKYTQEITITQSALRNVWWLNLGVKDLEFAFLFLHISNSLPSKFRPVVLELLLISAKTIVVVLEVRIGKLFLLLSHFL